MTSHRSTFSSAPITPISVADRLLHGPCNSERGDGSRDHERPALTGKRAKHNGADLGHRVMAWP
ncbi:hypothetical protein GBO18_05235 [Mycobacterium avium subsp. hominissuis]|nr:hypothetical protein [Mycobacterium avium subsp. hominissuis]